MSNECTRDGRFKHKKLIELMKQQITGQKEQMENQKQHFLKQLERQESLHKSHMEVHLSAADKTNTVASTFLPGATPSLCSSTRHRSSGQITGRNSVRLSAPTLFLMIKTRKFFLLNKLQILINCCQISFSETFS